MIVRADTSWTTRRQEALVASAALLFLAVASGGCAAGGLAVAGPLVSAIQALTDRSVERTLPADLHGASAVTLDTVSRLGFRVRDLRRADEAWTFEAANETLAVHGRLTRVAPAMTRLSLRVEAGTWSADKGTADEILSQITASLANQSAIRAPAAADGGGSGAFAALEAELRRLRLEIEVSRTRGGRTLGRDEVDARDGSGVISIPASYGVPTIAAPSAPPDPAASVATPVEPSRPDLVGVTLDRSPSPSVFATPLAPVDALRPLQPITETGSGGK